MLLQNKMLNFGGSMDVSSSASPATAAHRIPAIHAAVRDHQVIANSYLRLCKNETWLYEYPKEFSRGVGDNYVDFPGGGAKARAQSNIYSRWSYNNIKHFNCADNP